MQTHPAPVGDSAAAPSYPAESRARGGKEKGGAVEYVFELRKPKTMCLSTCNHFPFLSPPRTQPVCCRPDPRAHTAHAR